jgi:hypothetical protein
MPSARIGDDAIMRSGTGAVKCSDTAKNICTELNFPLLILPSHPWSLAACLEPLGHSHALSHGVASTPRV